MPVYPHAMGSMGYRRGTGPPGHPPTSHPTSIRPSHHPSVRPSIRPTYLVLWNNLTVPHRSSRIDLVHADPQPASHRSDHASSLGHSYRIDQESRNVPRVQRSTEGQPSVVQGLNSGDSSGNDQKLAGMYQSSKLASRSNVCTTGAQSRSICGSLDQFSQ